MKEIVYNKKQFIEEKFEIFLIKYYYLEFAPYNNIIVKIFIIITIIFTKLFLI